MIEYKINVMDELKKIGYSTTRLQHEKILPSQTCQNIKSKKPINTETLNKICLLLRKQPGDILKVVPTDEEKLKYF